jgi:hypothetical protein
MAERTYQIKPLAWRCVRPAGHGEGEWWTAESVFGSFDVEADDGGTRWRYCFDEFYDEGRHDCESVEAGKAAAEAYYQKRLLPALLARP